MHEVSQKLATATIYGTWEPQPPATEETIADLIFEAGVELCFTPEGSQLKAAGLIPRLMEVFGEHYAGSVPSKIPYFEELQLVARDLILELPNPKPVPVASTVPMETAVQKAKREEAEKAEAVRKVRARKFAAAVNEQIMRDGVKSINAAGNQRRVGRKLYSVDDFETLWKEAERFGFWGDTNVYGPGDRNV